MAQQSQKKHAVNLADNKDIISQAIWDEAWTHRCHAQDFAETLMAIDSDPTAKPKIIATAIVSVSRNNTDIPLQNAEGNWEIAHRGDKNFYGSSNAMAGEVLTSV